MSQKSSVSELTSEKCSNLEFSVLMKICKYLPQLEEEEKEQILLFSKDKSRDEELRLFYEALKQKNKTILFSIDVEDLHEYYVNKIVQDYMKENIFSKNNFDLINFLCNGSNITQFKSELENKLIESNSQQEVVCGKSSWNSFSFDASYLKLTSGELKDVFNNLLKFNYKFHTGSLYLNFFMIYPNIEEDLKSILSNTTSISRLVIKFNEKNDWSEEDVNSGVFGEIYKKNLIKVNAVIKCILLTVEKSNHLPVMCLISESRIKLDQENADLIYSIIDEKKTKVLSIKNLTFPEKKKFNQHIGENSQLVYFNQEGIEFSDSKAKKFMTNLMRQSLASRSSIQDEGEAPSYRRSDLI
jgi:hypothetical protein